MNCQLDNFFRIITYALNPEAVGELPVLVDPVNWDLMIQTAKAHNLFALFHEVAFQYPTYQKRADYEKNTQISLSIIAQQVKKTESFLKLYREFLKEDLHPIVMKGIICRQLYGKYAEHRPSGDEDILVLKEEFYIVKEFLEKRGYSCADSEITTAQLNQVEHVSFHDDKKNCVEVHINLMGRRNNLRIKMGEYFQDVFQTTQLQNIRDVQITTMAHTEHYLYLIMHAFKHFIGSGVGLRQMIDVMMYQKYYESELDWEKIKTILNECHADGYLGDVQELGMKYLGFNFNVTLPSCCSETLLDDVIEAGAFGKGDRADSIATNIIAGAMDQKRRSKVGTLIRAGFPSLQQMAEWTPYLNEKPWMLPIEWMRRWGRYFKRTKHYKGNLMLDSYKKSQERMELLKKYGL